MRNQTEFEASLKAAYLHSRMILDARPQPSTALFANLTISEALKRWAGRMVNEINRSRSATPRQKIGGYFVSWPGCNYRLLYSSRAEGTTEQSKTKFVQSYGLQTRLMGIIQFLKLLGKKRQLFCNDFPKFSILNFQTV